MVCLIINQTSHHVRKLFLGDHHTLAITYHGSFYFRSQAVLLYSDYRPLNEIYFRSALFLVN